MSQVAVGIGEIVGGILLAPFTGGASLIGVAAGVGTLIQAAASERQAKAEAGQLSTTSVPPAGQPYTPGPTEKAGGNTPGGGGTQYIPNAQDVIDERADAANLALVAYEQQGLTSIMNLKLQEKQQESGISFGAAARGLKLEGSPLYQMVSQKSAGERAIGGAETQYRLGEKAQQVSNLASYNAGLLSMSNTNLNIQTNLQNEWLASLSDLINMSSSFLGRFWNPSQSMGGYRDPYWSSSGAPYGYRP